MNAAEIIKNCLGEDAHAPAPPRNDPSPWDEITDDEARLVIMEVPAHGITTFPEQMTQALAFPVEPLGALNRAANTTFNVPVGWSIGAIDMSRLYRAMVVVTGGGSSTGAGCTLNGGWFAGNTTNSLQTYTGAAWTWTQTGATINVANTLTAFHCTSEIRADQMPSNTRYLAFVLNNNCATVFDCVAVCAGGAYRPSSQFNNTAILGQSVT